VDLKWRRVTRDGHRVSGVGLQLDGVRAGLRGESNDLESPIEAPVVIRRELRDQVSRLIRTDEAVSNLNRSRHVCFPKKMQPVGLARWPTSSQQLGEPISLGIDDASER
jgi:hypothetical protein